MQPECKDWQQLAAQQHALLSRSQALSLGITRRQIDGLLRRGSWIRCHPRVYRLAAAPRTWQQAMMAASLWADGKAAICGRSAAALWELEGYWRSRVELCGRCQRSPPAGVLYHRVRQLKRADVSVRWGIRVTSVPRTILDLSTVVSARTLERTLDEALRKRLMTLDEMHHCLERQSPRGKEGIARLKALLEERRDQLVPDSAFESDVARVLREHGLPTAVKRYRVVEGNHSIAEVDFAWPSRKVAIQAHGASFHRQPRTWEKDQRVENELQLHGWFVAKVTPRMLKEEEENWVELVRRALATRHFERSAS